MAMVDYGAVVFKNGIVQNKKEFFMDMEKTVGWTDTDIDITTNKMAGNYFAFVGDPIVTFGFYKLWMSIKLNKEKYGTTWGTRKLDKNADYIDYDFSRKSIRFNVNKANVHIKEIDKRIYLASIRINGENYNIVYGYGIDSNPNTWNNVKVKYLGKKTAKKVDNIYNKLDKQKVFVAA